jgi:hypothetical protein
MKILPFRAISRPCRFRLHVKELSLGIAGPSYALTNITRCKEPQSMMAANDHDLEAWLLALPAYLLAVDGLGSIAGEDIKERCRRILALACRIEPDATCILDWWHNDALVALEGLTPREALEMGQGERLEAYLSGILADG